MERTLISFSPANLITVPAMAFLGFLLAALIWQLAKRAVPGLAAMGGDDTDGPGSF